jgi:hypothetical protein
MATTTSSSFAKSTTAKYKVRTTSTTSALASTGDTLVSSAIASDVDLWENKKIVMGVDIKVAYLDVVAILAYQLSHDGINWTAGTTLSADITPNVTGVKIVEADFSDKFAPYMRVIVNEDGKSMGTSGTCQFFFAYK